MLKSFFRNVLIVARVSFVQMHCLYKCMVKHPKWHRIVSKKDHGVKASDVMILIRFNPSNEGDQPAISPD